MDICRMEHCGEENSAGLNRLDWNRKAARTGLQQGRTSVSIEELTQFC